VPTSLRDGARASPIKDASAPNKRSGAGDILPARKFTKYVDYDFSKMTDTKGGFLSAQDDPWNRAMQHAKPGEEKPEHMTLAEWERLRLLKSLREQKAGPFEPGISVLKDKTKLVCYECQSMEIDWKWEEIFGCRVCNSCKEKKPEKYSLLTKTEAREDYLLTDPELKDPELLPHLERPNPHKATWNNMMLYLRFQIEEYAFSAKKWGSPEALDAEFEKRIAEQKNRKEKKFKEKLKELKKRTRTEAYRRQAKEEGNGKAAFGDRIGEGKHVHEWGQAVEDPDTGMTVKSCVECGMEVEELEF
jgi:DNA-repair protein complementing XP-A cells